MSLRLLLILSMILPGLALGCAQEPKEPNATRLSYSNPVDAMRLPPKPYKNNKLNTKEQPGESTGPVRSKIDLDLTPHGEDQGPTSQKIVIITQSQAKLRKGPGLGFKVTRTAKKGDVFKLLRTTPQTDTQPAWHFVEDTSGKKYFVSSQVSTVSTKELKPPRSIALQTHKKVTPSKIRKVLDPTPPLPKELAQAKHISLNFDGTEVYDVITTFCELLQINYLIEGDISGKITLQTFNKIPAQDLYAVFEQILAINNITVVKSGNFYRFLPIKNAAKKPLSLYYGNDPRIPDRDRLVIQLIPLKYLTPDAMKRVIAPLLSANATMLDVPETNTLLVIDLASNLKRLNRIVQALDTDKLASSEIHLYTVQHADAETMVEELNEILTTIGYGNAMDSALTLLPITRLNSILVVTSLNEVLETVEFWIGKLDQPTSGGKLSTFVYYIQNAEAEKLSTILNSIFEEKKADKIGAGITPIVTPIQDKEKKKTSTRKLRKIKTAKTKPKPGIQVEGGVGADFEGEILIIPDKDTNSLIIRTNPRNYPAVLELIKKLDLLPQQVLIEVLILDLTLDNETLLGLEWAMQGTIDGHRVGGGSAPSTASLGSQIGNTATSLFAPGASFFVQNKDKFIALLQAFASDSKINIVANPILVTSDNKEANISITDDIPIQSTTITTPTAGQPLTQSTIEFRDVGIKLGILPKINSDNFVNLKIDQEISDQGPTIQNTPSFITRSVKTEVVLKDNEILVMGGLMRTTTNETMDGVPYLKDIPLLGKLFGTESISTKKTELMLFITPHIISNTDDSKFVTDQFRKKLGNLRKMIIPVEEG